MQICLSIEKGSTGFTQKEMKLYAPKRVSLAFGHSPYVGHYQLVASGPRGSVVKFLREYVGTWAASLAKDEK